MRSVVIAGIVAGLLVGPLAVEGRERELADLPRDVWSVATAWTEPIKSVAQETRRFDPVSGMWFGLLEGSVKSVERVTNLFLPEDKDAPHAAVKGSKVLLRYSF